MKHFSVILILLSSTCFANAESYSAKINYLDFFRNVIENFQVGDQNHYFFEGEDDCKVVVTRKSTEISLSFFEDSILKGRLVVNSGSQIFASIYPLYTVYRIGAVQFTLVSGDGIYLLKLKSHSGRELTCGTNA